MIGDDVDKFMQLALKINFAKFEEIFVKTQRFLRVFFNFISANLMNDNFYAFSYNETLLNMDVSELMKIKDLRVKYIQVDSMNKCIP